MRAFNSLLLLLISAFTVHGLLNGAEWLFYPTPGLSAIPLGNFMTWMTLVAMAALLLNATRDGEKLRVYALVMLALAVLWMPMGRLVSGNWRLQFHGETLDYTWFLTATAFIALGLLAGMLMMIISRLTGKEP